MHHKVYLPTYGLFVKDVLAWGDSICAFDTRFGRAGMLICEDFWHASPTYLLWLDGADLLFFMSSSPGRGLNASPQLESARWVEHINRATPVCSLPLLPIPPGRFEDGLHFWGGATLFDPNGELVAQALTKLKHSH